MQYQKMDTTEICDGVKILETKPPSEICESLRIFAKYGSFTYLRKISDNHELWNLLKPQLINLDFCSYAAKFKNLLLLKWLISDGFKYDEITSSYAIINNDLEMLKWLGDCHCKNSNTIKLFRVEDLIKKTNQLREMYHKDTLLATYVSLINDNMEMFEWFIQRDYAIDHATLQLLLKSNNTIKRNYFFKWFIDHLPSHILVEQIDVTTFVRENDFSMLQWSVERGCKVDKNATYIAVINNNFEMLKLLVDKKYAIDYYCAKQAVIHDNFEILKWLVSNGCEIRKELTSDAIVFKKFEILKWLVKNGCQWDDNAAYFMAKTNSFDMIKWAVENDCPWTKKICSNAAYNGDFEMLKWARESGCPWNKKVCHNAAVKEHFDILKWALKNKCPWDELANSYVKKNPSMMEWLTVNKDFIPVDTKLFG